LSLVLGSVAAVCALAVTGGVLTAFRPADFETVMRNGGLRHLAILGSTFVSVACAAVGFFVSLNSIHRLNKKTNVSWTAFFVCAGALALVLSSFVFFWFTKDLLRITGGQS